MFRKLVSHSMPAARLLCFAVVPLLLAGLLGCGEQDPVTVLYDLGAQLDRNDRGRVTTVAFPPETTDADLQVLSQLPEIKDLDLSGAQITDAGLKQLETLDKLEVLNLSVTGITDAGLEHLQDRKTLRRLSLGDTSVTDAGLEHLEGLENLEQLSLVGKPEPQEPEARTWRDAIRLGIDLAGGTNLVFQVDEAAAAEMEKPITSELMDQLVGAIARRLNPSGTEEITVRRVGNSRIEVIIPGADRDVVAEKKRLMTQLGSLEFAILANRRDHEEIIRDAQKLSDVENDVRDGERVRASWRDVGRDQQGNPKDIFDDPDSVTRTVQRDGEDVKQFLVILDTEERRVTGQFLTRANQTTDENGAPAIGFRFNQRGAQRFRRLTSENRPRADGSARRLAILLDGNVHSAPNLRDTISSSGQISGRFSQAEIDALINVLNAGALEVPIIETPISEFTISPLLGSDVQEKGRLAITIAAVTVFVFMLVYYRFAGLVANLCLALNLILVLGTMAFIKATFTLPGLAGLVLTIGMAVDANVLIFERIREESKRGSSLRMAIHNGFSRAFTTIVDANVTTLITAVVLYMIGTDQVRGFAVTLFIGIVMSMFTSLYFGRLVFDVCERKRWITSLKMFSVVGATSFQFTNKKVVAACCSLVLIAAGLVSLGARGTDNLDIDFSGGTMVTLEFKEGSPTVEDIRPLLASKFEAGFTLEQLSVANPDGTEEQLFRLRTTQQRTDEVRKQIVQAFADGSYELHRVSVDFDRDQIAVIPVATPPPSANGDERDGSDVDAPTVTSSDPEYAGGHQVELSFSDAVKPTAISRSLVEALNKITQDGGRPKYDQPASLYELVGLVGPDQNSAAADVLEFRGMQLKTRPELSRDDLETALVTMQQEMEDSPIFEEVNSFESSIASEMRQSAIMAMLVSLVAIVAYIWYRFERITFGLAAVVALLHDVLVVLGMVALAAFVSQTAFGAALDLYDFKINLPMIAAFLTIVGYSLNDTIVVFDRIREVRGKNPAMTAEIVNTSLNQTLARTILTSLTTFVVVAILYAIGGEGIHGFAFCLVLGVIFGTYSSIFVASPVLLWLMNRPGSDIPPSRAARRTTASAGRPA